MRARHSKLSDYPVDHRLMDVPDTPRMAQVAQQIEQLQADYLRLREREQRRQFANGCHRPMRILHLALSCAAALLAAPAFAQTSYDTYAGAWRSPVRFEPRQARLGTLLIRNRQPDGMR